MPAPDRTKSLEQLDGNVWPHNDFASHVVQESQRLRKIPLSALGVEGLRLLIGQKIGLEFIVPLAIEFVQDHPLIEATYYPGDLLSNLLALPSAFWARHPELNNSMVELGLELRQIYERLGNELLPALERFQYQ